VTVVEALIIFAAAFLAGMINSVAGGGTLVSFPTLIWIGLDPIVANVTSTVALLPGSLGGALGFRRELAGSRRWIKQLIAPSCLGGVLGALLLLRTPSETFAFLVPYLILFATLLFALQGPLTRRLQTWEARRINRKVEAAADGGSMADRSVINRAAPAYPTDEPKTSNTWLVGAVFFQFLVAVYGGYFGAGIGILMLAALGVLGLTDIHQMNGLKNLFAFCINSIASIYFISSGAVSWTPALIMAVGSVAGGYGGAGVARKVGREVVRRAVIAIGILMAISLFLDRG
jgi:hypothetical protein